MKRHFAIALVTALAAAAAAAITSGSAYAGTALSLQLCHGNQISTYVTPDPLAVVNGQPISYGDPWHDSMPVRDGDVVRLRASGCVTYHGPDTSLWLAQNDDNTTDNSGRWDIGISHYGL